MNLPPPLILASQSPRRARLLREAGIDFEQRSPPYADPDQPPKDLSGHDAERYAVDLARQKAQSLGTQLTAPATVLAADTICVDAGGRLVGKPADRADARAMLRSFVNRDHRVITGVALIHFNAPAREVETARASCVAEQDCSNNDFNHCFADTATVRFGSITQDQLDPYLATDDWQGKAGGYNLFDRQAAGWPIQVQGDPATVVGLPMRRLVPLLAASLHSGR